MGATNESLPNSEANAAVQEAITEEQAKFFLDNGYLVIRNVLSAEELRLLREQTQGVVDKGIAGEGVDEDYLYRVRGSGERVYWRTEYVIDKLDATKALLGHPFILKSVEKLQGNNFVPTWDSLVVKIPSQAASVPWHRDAEVPVGCADPRPIFNVDFYLDDADEKSCLWVIPGSNRWDPGSASERCARPGFDFDGAIPVQLTAGDVIFHDIQLLHGSPEGEGNALRRTIYYEFRSGEIEVEFGPHTLEYLTIKQRLLNDCIDRRKQTLYGASEKSFEYRPAGALALAGGEVPPQTEYRYPHEKYWRT
ncbi:phytanoyl-CoA dioxygenase family protein [Cohnella lupini]|uniref:Ectoine hydroxylase-related dioxygenase (Phytanoyl-CoA dioxygenase family) n=1 Tax=Cohnella lupini TaxID=1294267 RepID=A0A3D9ISQ3_9BACL|nr:phytanoyl-CoA dioxygenase family protein [Cohnella lupini]RED64823.1 ectoine hydroxylase-related dioxygenase (phytanoyl-CoA dioxygenase family) [Cohnella lupini]